MDYLRTLAPTIIDRRFYTRGQVICQAGNRVDAIWLILRGDAVLKTGKEQQATFFKSAGSLYGDVEHILGLPYQGNLIAIDKEGVELARLSPTKFDKAVAEASPFMQALTRLNAARVLKSARFIEARESLLDKTEQELRAIEMSITAQFYPNDYDPQNPPEYQIAAE